MRVLRARNARPTLPRRTVFDKVKELALRLGTGEPTKDDLVLDKKLQKATGSAWPSSRSTPSIGPTSSQPSAGFAPNAVLTLPILCKSTFAASRAMLA